MSGEPDTGSSLLDRSLFQPYLEPDEKIIWIGRPGRIRWFGPGGRQKYVYGLGFSALGIFIYVLKRMSERPDHPTDASILSSPLYYLTATAISGGWALAITVVALLFVVLRVRRLKHMSYALTDRHAMSIDRDTPNGFKAEGLAMLNRFGSAVRRDGSGYIVFGYRKERGRMNEVPRMTFDDIDNVAKVLRLAQDAVLKLPPSM